MDQSLSDFSVHGVSQARILEWVATSFSRGSPLSPALAGGFFTTEIPGNQRLSMVITKTRPLYMLSKKDTSDWELI